MAILTDKTELFAPALGDLLHIVDVSNQTDNLEGSSRKIQTNTLLANTIGYWDPLKTYAVDDIVVYDGLAYLSLQGSNLNKNPLTETTYWELRFNRARLTQRLVRSEADMPTPVAGVATLEPGVNYIFDGRDSGGVIYITNDWLVPAMAAGQYIDMETEPNTTVVYLGSNALFNGNFGSGSLELFSFVAVGTPAGTLFNLIGDGGVNTLIQAWKCFFDGFGDLGFITAASIVNTTDTGFRSFGSGLSVSNCVIFESVRTLYDYSVPIGGTVLSVSGTFGVVGITVTQIIPLPGDSALFIDPAVNVTFFDISHARMTAAFGGSIFQPGVTGAITAFADSATSPGVKTTVTSATHGLLDGQTLLIKDNFIYGGGYTISNVTTNTFDIVKVFSVTGTGSWDTSSLDQTDLRIVSRGSRGIPDSQIIGSFLTEGNVIATPILATNQWEKVLGTTIAAENERAAMTDNNELTFLNLEKQSGEILWTFNASVLGGSTVNLEFTVFKNGAKIPNVTIFNQTSARSDSLALSTTTDYISGDLFSVYVRDTSAILRDVLVSNMQVTIK